MHRLSWNSALISWRLPVWRITSFPEWSSDFLGWYPEVFLESFTGSDLDLSLTMSSFISYMEPGRQKIFSHLPKVSKYIALSRIALFFIIVHLHFKVYVVFFMCFLWIPLWISLNTFVNTFETLYERFMRLPDSGWRLFCQDCQAPKFFLPPRVLNQCLNHGPLWKSGAISGSPTPLPWPQTLCLYTTPLRILRLEVPWGLKAASHQRLVDLLFV